MQFESPAKASESSGGCYGLTCYFHHLHLKIQKFGMLLIPEYSHNLINDA